MLYENLERYREKIAELEEAMKEGKHKLVVKLYHNCEDLENTCLAEMEKLREKESKEKAREYALQLKKLQKYFTKIVNKYFERL